MRHKTNIRSRNKKVALNHESNLFLVCRHVFFTQRGFTAAVNANKGYFQLWRTQVVFTWQWWLQLALTIIPVSAWIILRKSDSTGRLLYAAFFVILASSLTDFVGNSFGLWYYALKLAPVFPPFFPWETFIGEPLANWMGLYSPVHWRYIYSFPIYVANYMIAHYVSQSHSFKRLDSE